MSEVLEKQVKGLLWDALVESVQITRHAVKDGGPDSSSKPVLTTVRELNFIEAGISVWRVNEYAPHGLTPGRDEPPRVEVDAHWYTAQAALTTGIKVVSGSDANTFGAMGTLLVPTGFSIPTVLATTGNVRYYGLKLIRAGEEFAVTSDRYPIALMQYDYTADYKRDFLMRVNGGGGIFVETHDFPHIHIPSSPSCGGYIVIGKRLGPTRFSFTAFQIPYGYALYTPSNAIHGDGTLVGEYALTVTDPALTPADTVLMYDRDSLEMARYVVPDWQR